MKECPHSRIVKKNMMEQYLYCSLKNDICIKQKYCMKNMIPQNTTDWIECTILKKEENRNGKK